MKTQDITNIALLAALAGGAWWLYKQGGNLKTAFNPFSDKNLAYGAADSIAKVIGGEKATVSDIVPGINTYDPNKAANGKPSALPSANAPYWYNQDGTKRTKASGLMATAYDYNHRLIQIIDKATQRAVFV